MFGFFHSRRSLRFYGASPEEVAAIYRRLEGAELPRAVNFEDVAGALVREHGNTAYQVTLNEVRAAASRSLTNAGAPSRLSPATQRRFLALHMEGARSGRT